MTHVERQRFWRGVLTCTTCATVVTVGPPEPDPSMAVYRLGLAGAADPRRHLDQCPGGEMKVTAEEEPPAVAQPSLVSPPPGKGKPRGPYKVSAGRAMARLIRKGRER